jgi:AcrR family transcriptional regulator
MEHMVHKFKAPELSTSKDARVRYSRQVLRLALIRLLEEKSFEQITIREIAQTAEIGYTTFFRHHPTKESLLREVVASEVDNLNARVEPLVETLGTRASCLAMCKYVHENRALWSLFLTGPGLEAIREELQKASFRLSARHHPRSGKSELPFDLGVILTVSGIVELLTWCFRHKPKASPEQIGALLYDFVISPTLKARAP